MSGKILIKNFYRFTISQPGYSHLSLHSKYSIRDGVVRVDETLAAGHRNAIPAFAINDLNNFLNQF